MSRGGCKTTDEVWAPGPVSWIVPPVASIILSGCLFFYAEGVYDTPGFLAPGGERI